MHQCSQRAKEVNMRSALAIAICVLVVWSAAAYAEYTTTTIYNIQQGMHAAGDSVRVENVVVTALDLKPTTYGFMAQEVDGGPWSAILVYTSGIQPYNTWSLEVGDMVTVQGIYAEYLPASASSVSEINVYNAGDVTIVTEDYGEPACELLSCGDLPYDLADSTWGEQWEGVYVCVDTVQVVAHGDYQEWTVIEYHEHPPVVDHNSDSLRIDDKLVDPTLNLPAIGDTLVSIKGVMSEEYGNYRLWPRGTEDLEFMGPPPGPNLLLAFATSQTSIQVMFDRRLNETSAENVNNYYLESDTQILQAILNLGNYKNVKLITATQPDTLLDSLVVCDVQSEEGTAMFECQKSGFMSGITPMWYVQRPAVGSTYFDDSQLIGQEVTVSGIVTSGSDDFGGPFFMRDDRGPWNSLYIYWPGASVTRGDSITVAGYIDEYYGLTEMTSLDYYYNFGSRLPVNPDTVANTVLMADSLASESYEACLVHLDSMEVTTYVDAYGEWDVDDIGHSASVPIGDFAVTYGSGYAYPGCGSIVDIQGCFRWDYGEYKLEPRDSADIVVLIPCTAGAKAGDGLTARLDQNSPNPFAAGTAIRFVVPSKTRVKVAVYDVTGRLVKELRDEVMTPGEYTVTWDGRDTRSEEVGPGVYFYTFTSPAGVFQKKMVVLK
jgi:hypothetical protein